MKLLLVFSFLYLFGTPAEATVSSWPPKNVFSDTKNMRVKSLRSDHLSSDDISKADADGPHVFYRDGKTVVKTIVRQDTNVLPSIRTFLRRESVGALTCEIPETGDKFSFTLRSSLEVPPFEYDLPSKMLVISDIEGNFKGFKLLLQGNQVMDEQFKWSFGKGHLVLIGDFFDRGLNVTEVLWLVYKLEVEAEAAGGRVHFIIGNHEILNLVGNTQYVRNKYLENADLLEEPYRNWFDADSELGRWLRSKNAIERIGDIAFCHGGISPQLVESRLSLARVNELGRRFAGFEFGNIGDADARTVFDQKTGIYWFRGIAKKQVPPEHVDAALAWAGAKRLVLGHTLMEDVTSIYNGRVFCIDLYHDENLRQGYMKSLWIEDGVFYGINDRGEKSSVFAISFSKS